MICREACKCKTWMEKIKPNERGLKSRVYREPQGFFSQRETTWGDICMLRSESHLENYWRHSLSAFAAKLVR